MLYRISRRQRRRIVERVYTQTAAVEKKEEKNIVNNKLKHEYDMIGSAVSFVHDDSSM